MDAGRDIAASAARDGYLFPEDGIALDEGDLGGGIGFLDGGGCHESCRAAAHNGDMHVVVWRDPRPRVGGVSVSVPRMYHVW